MNGIGHNSVHAVEDWQARYERERAARVASEKRADEAEQRIKGYQLVLARIDVIHEDESLTAIDKAIGTRIVRAETPDGVHRVSNPLLLRAASLRDARALRISIQRLRAAGHVTMVQSGNGRARPTTYHLMTEEEVLARAAEIAEKVKGVRQAIPFSAKRGAPDDTLYGERGASETPLSDAESASNAPLYGTGTVLAEYTRTKSNITKSELQVRAAKIEPQQAQQQPEKKKSQSSAKRGTRLPDDWTLPLAWGRWALETYTVSEDDVRREAMRFRNFWTAKSGKDATKINWRRTWENWCDNDRTFGNRRRPVNEPPILTQAASGLSLEEEYARMREEDERRARGSGKCAAGPA